MNTAIKHTPEPWRVYNSESKIFDYEQQLIAFASSVPYRSHNAPANAARIVACVNACEGMIDPSNEILAIRRTLESFREQRNELLLALQELKEEFTKQDLTLLQAAAILKAHETINKIKGGIYE